MLRFVHAGPPEAALFSAALFALAAFAARALILGRRRAKLRRHFFALPPAARDALVKNPKSVNAEGIARTVTCLSCRLPDAARLEQELRDQPSHFVRLFDGTLQSLIQTVLATGGTVERFGADGFSACWNAPLADANHAVHACAAAAQMLNAMQQHNRFPLRDMKSEAPQPLTIAIGIATAPAIAGLFGETWSVAGEAVGRAEELREQCGALGFSAIADAATQASTSLSFALLDIGDANNPLFALLGDRSTRASPKFRALSTFHERIQAAISAHAFGDARELIAQARKLSGASAKFYDRLSARIAALETASPVKQHVA